MDPKGAGSSLDSLISSFNTRIVELQELVIARNMYAASTITDLSEVDAAVKTMEFQVQAIKDKLREEKEALPKAKKLIELSLRQQRKLQHMLTHLPLHSLGNATVSYQNPKCSTQATTNCDVLSVLSRVGDEPAAAAPPPPPKEKKGRGSVPRWYLTAEELDSLSSYMRGRLTLDKVNAAVNEMATYAEANSHLITAPKKKLGEDAWEKALELRDIAMTEAVKGKHFFLESDMKGSGLKLDTTGKAILTILRHLGRIQETRVAHHRVITLSKPQ